MTHSTVWMVLGLGLGLGLAFGVRRWLPARRKRQRAAMPVVYASRQHLRRAERDQRKREAAGQRAGRSGE
jgi:hypothetical protein